MAARRSRKALTRTSGSACDRWARHGAGVAKAVADRVLDAQRGEIEAGQRCCSVAVHVDPQRALGLEQRSPIDRASSARDPPRCMRSSPTRHSTRRGEAGPEVRPVASANRRRTRRRQGPRPRRAPSCAISVASSGFQSARTGREEMFGHSRPCVRRLDHDEEHDADQDHQSQDLVQPAVPDVLRVRSRGNPFIQPADQT